MMIPKTIGRYVIHSELGRGSTASVYQAYDPDSRREVAVKVLPREFMHDEQFRSRFEREAQAVASLAHPAIVPVYGFGEDHGQPYIVMRLMPGGSLAERVKQSPLKLDEAARVLARLAPALDTLHRQSIVHRDLKPGNILFDQDGNAYLSDFGIARSSSVEPAGSEINGTPAYMSPEQIQGKRPIDGRSDIYALGIILYQMLTGELPSSADLPTGQLVSQAAERASGSQDGRWRQVVRKALAKDPRQRFASAAELVNALQEAAKP